MRKITPAKMTMAVAVSWGLFVGASVVSYAQDNENTPQGEPESTDDNCQDCVDISYDDNNDQVSADSDAPSEDTPASSDIPSLVQLTAGPDEDISLQNMQAETLSEELSTEENNETRHLSLAILSDTHYISNDQKGSEHSQQHIAETAQTEMRMLEEIDGIIDATLDKVAETKPDCLLVCGDLTSNGEYSGAQALADKLNAVKQTEGMEDVDIYVVNGNHDINNSYAADMTTEEVGAATRIRPEDFKDVFDGLGYGDDDHYDGGTRTVYTPENDDPTITQNHGGLSYATEIAKGVTLVVMDTGIYNQDDFENSRFSDAQKTAGYVSEGLLNWVVQQTTDAKSKGNLVLGMCHHSVMPHYTVSTPTMDTYMAEFVIGNHLEVSTALADAGMSAVLTGHSHANDIAKFVSPDGNVLYDIQTAALCAYPVAWRTVNVDITGSGQDAVYSFSIDTTFMDHDFDSEGINTDTWTVTTGGTTRSFKDDFGGSMQDYSYVKTGVTPETIEPAVDYLLKETFYKAATSDNGIENYVKDKLQIPEDESVASFVINQAVDLTGKSQSIDTNVAIPLLGTVGIKADLASDGSQDRIIKYNVTVSNTQNPEKPVTETGVVSVNLNGITAGINSIFEQIDSCLGDKSWQDSNYKSSTIQKEVSKLVANVLGSALSQPIDSSDENSTGFNIANDALQAFAKGSEGKEQTDTRKRYQDLLKSDTFDAILKKAIWGGIYKASSGKKDYPILNEILSTPLAPDKVSSIVNITDISEGSTCLKLAKMLIADKITSPASAISTIYSLSSDGALIPSSLTGMISGALAEMQLSLTQDTNIPDDSNWQFHTITLYTGNQYDAVRNTLTVEDFMAGGLFAPGMDNYEFTGWYTAPEGGTLVTADMDFTDIYKVYAHWNYIGGSSEDDDRDDASGDVIGYVDYQNPEYYIVDPESGATIADYIETEEEIYQKLDDAIAALNEADDNQAAAPGAISLLQSAASSDEIKVARQISNDIVDGQGNEVKDTVFLTDTGSIGINLGKLSFLRPSLVKSLSNLQADLELFFIQNGRLVRIRIPRGTDISRFADKNGFIGLWYLKAIIESGTSVLL